MKPTKPIQLFYSYSHEDEDLLNQLRKHLWSLRQQSLIEEWHDRKMMPGTRLNYEIDGQIEKADLIILLVSSSYMDSDSCQKEMLLAIGRQSEKKCRVVPIILKPTEWQYAPFKDFLLLPNDAQPVTLWKNQDEAFVDIAKGLRKVIEEINASDATRATFEKHISVIKKTETVPLLSTDFDNEHQMRSLLVINVFDGARRPFPVDNEISYSIFNGQGEEVSIIANSKIHVSDFKFHPSFALNVPFFGYFEDNHRVIVCADHWQQCGYSPIRLNPQLPTVLDLMLIPENPTLDFSQVSWEEVKRNFPFLAYGVDEYYGRARFADLVPNKPKALASLLNIIFSMKESKFADGTTPLDYIKQFIWDESLAQDRFFAYCDQRLSQIVRDAAVTHHMFVAENEKDYAIFHPGYTVSWKQVLLKDANLRLTFHENVKRVIDGIECVLFEPDIDYYKANRRTLVANKPEFFGGLTNPELVYVLRWVESRRAGGDFNPPYTIV